MGARRLIELNAVAVSRREASAAMCDIMRELGSLARARPVMRSERRKTQLTTQPRTATPAEKQLAMKW